MVEMKVTHSIFVPAFIYAIGAHPNLPKEFPRTFQQLAVTGDIVTEDMKSQAKEIFGKQLMFRSGHGMSEGGGLIAWDPEDAFDDSVFPTTEGGIMPLGKVRPGGKVKVASMGPGSKHRPVKVGEHGELHYQGKAFIDRYVNDRERDSCYEDENGRWFRTGDLGMMDEGGFLYILSRIKDVIKCKGVPISPTGLEVVLNTERDVTAKVIGLPHHACGAVPVAVVRCPSHKRSGKPETLKERALRSVGEDRAIHSAYFLEDLGFSEFPLNATGKVIRRDLVQAITASENGKAT